MAAVVWFFVFQAEDGIRDLVRSRGLGDVYKSQGSKPGDGQAMKTVNQLLCGVHIAAAGEAMALAGRCLLYTSDAADERSSVDLGGRRLIKKKKQLSLGG